VNTGRAIVFFAWGAEYVDRVASCIRESRLPEYPVFLITDSATNVSGLSANITVVPHDCELSGKARKTELFTCLPEQIQTALILDADTRVIDDVSLGFEKAERHGIAMVPAPHYSLADFRDFRQVMLTEGVMPRGQIIYNSGVIFCTPHRPNPGTLSPSFNYRGFGELIQRVDSHLAFLRTVAGAMLHPAKRDTFTATRKAS